MTSVLPRATGTPSADALLERPSLGGPGHAARAGDAAATAANAAQSAAADAEASARHDEVNARDDAAAARAPFYARSLFAKYFAYFVAIVVSALVASGAVQLYFGYRENESALLTLQQTKAAAAAYRIDDYVRGIEQQLGWMRLPQADPMNVEQRRIDYLKLLRLVPAITTLSLVDGDGREKLRVSRVTMDETGSNADFSKEPKFTEPRAGRTYFGPVYFLKDTEPYMVVSVPGFNARSGVTIAEVNLKFIWDVVNSIKIGEHGAAYVVDNAGQLIAHPDISYVLRKSDLSGLPQVKAAMDAGDRPSVTTARIARNQQGTQVFTAWASIPALGWHVFVEQPLSDAYAPLYASLRRTGLLLLGGVLLAVVGSMFFARRMVQPIAALQRGAAELSQGRLEQRISIDRHDEVGQLARQFNEMAERLRESYTGLERKVEERTRQLREAMNEIEEKGRQLEVANQHKSEFLASMSHELRTPLNAILGFSEVLQERLFGDLNDKQAEYVTDIHSSGQHLLALINEVLDLSKIEAGRMELDRTTFDIAAALQGALSLVKERAGKHGLALELQCEPEIGSIHADERKFKQIMLNLLSNAVKFTPAGGRVTVRAERFADRVDIAVSDTGIGIRPEDHAAVFEQFRQVGTDHLKKAEGTGLGLALTKSLVELHGGTIRLDSEVGKGSTFTISLPLVEAA